MSSGLPAPGLPRAAGVAHAAGAGIAAADGAGALPASGEEPSSRPPEALSRLNEHLAALTLALQGRDAPALLQAADQLVATLDGVAPALREPGTLTPALRRQLAYAVGRVAVHREALARATASVERAIEALLPSPLPAATYTAGGFAERGAAQPSSAWA